MKALDLLLSFAAIAIGVLHSFIVAPQVYDALTQNAFWFFGAGLAIIYAGLINILRALHGGRIALLRWSAFGVSVVMCVFIVVFAVTQNEFTNPVVFAQLVIYAGLTTMALVRR